MAMIKNRLTAAQLTQRIRLSALASRSQLLGLIALFGLSTLWLSPPGEANPLVIWLVQTLPLLAFVPSILKSHPRPYIWLCFVILLYFCAGVIYAVDGSPLGMMQTLLSAGLFCTAMMYARWKSLLNGVERDAALAKATDG
jgi:uncharacterized membrane protein